MSTKIYYNLKENYYIKASQFPGEGYIEPILFGKKGHFYRLYKNKHNIIPVNKKMCVFFIKIL